MNDFKYSFSGISDEIPHSETANAYPETLIYEVKMNIAGTINGPVDRLEKIRARKVNEALMMAEKQQIRDIQDTLFVLGRTLDLVEIGLNETIPKYGEMLIPGEIDWKVTRLKNIFDTLIKIEMAKHLQTFQDRMVQFTLLMEHRYGVGFKVPYKTNLGSGIMRLSDADFTHRVFRTSTVNWRIGDELSRETVYSPADKGGFGAQSSLSTEYAEQLVRDMKVILKMFLPLAKRFGAYENRIIIAIESLKNPTEK